ncbi:hypothetical protein IV102_19195 [bacterium]|nr:hypothetical protein [bacterium]
MNFREQMSQMRREYRTQASKLDKRLNDVTERTEAGFTQVGNHMVTLRDQVGTLGHQMQNLTHQMQNLTHQMLAMHDQMGATVESIQQVKADHQETSRTLQGRSRLLEDRFGKMLDLVASNVTDSPTRLDFEALLARIEALEKKVDSAA